MKTPPALRRRLAAELAAVQARLGEWTLPESAGGQPDEGNHVAETTARDLANADRERLLEQRGQLESALARVDEDRYGVCADCDEEIAPARLEAMPAAERCRACQEAREYRASTRAARGVSDEDEG